MANSFELNSIAELPMIDRYVRSVALCNSLALLTSSGTMKEFLLRFSVLTQLQRYWTDGQSYLKVVVCSEEDAETAASCETVTLAMLPPSTVEDDNVGTDYSGFASDSTLDLKPALTSKNLVERNENSAKLREPKEKRQPMTRSATKTISCKECGEVFRTQAFLRKHTSAVHRKKQKAFPSAGEKATENDVAPKQRSQRSRKGNIDGQWSSDSVEDSSNEPQQLTISDNEFTTCSICDHVFESFTECVEHSRTHVSESKVCNVCGYKTDSAWVMRTHMYKHTGERPYKCRVCELGFAQPSTRNYHEKTHSDELPYVCNVCGKLFKRPSLLKLHMKIHTGIKSLSCSQCESRFMRRCDLMMHMRKHTGEKPFSCEVCMMPFSARSKLKRHMMVHTGARPFTCDICGHQFTTRSNLNIHMRVHSGEKPYECKHCHVRFAHSGSLSQHVVNVHSDEATVNL